MLPRTLVTVLPIVPSRLLPFPCSVMLDLRWENVLLAIVSALPAPPIRLSVVRWLMRTVLTWFMCRLRHPAGLLLQACILMFRIPRCSYLLQPAFRLIFIPPFPRLVVAPTAFLPFPPISVRTLETAQGAEKLHPPPCLLETAIRPTIILTCPELSDVSTLLYPAGPSDVLMLRRPVSRRVNLILKLANPLLLFRKSNGGQAFLSFISSALCLPIPPSRFLLVKSPMSTFVISVMVTIFTNVRCFRRVNPTPILNAATLARSAELPPANIKIILSYSTSTQHTLEVGRSEDPRISLA